MRISELKDLKVCFLAGTLGRGGAERQLIYMLRALVSAGVGVRVLCLTKGEPLEEEILAIGVNVTWVGESRHRAIRLLRIIRELRREPAHIIQSAHFYTNIYAAIGAWGIRAKAIGAIRNDLTSELSCNGMMGWWQLHLPTRLIANSELGRNRAIAKRINPDRIDFVPNAVDDKRLEERNESLYRGRNTRILFAGRLCEQKRPDRFLRVIERIIRTRPDLNVKGTVVGDGPLRRDMTSLASKLGLASEDVTFLGEVKDVRRVYSKSHLLMLTSDWEGTPNVLLEAMGCGLPIVTTRVGGVPEIIGNDRGLIVEPNDEDGLTAAALQIIGDESLRAVLSSRGKEYVARFHSLTGLRDKMMDIYQRILKT